MRNIAIGLPMAAGALSTQAKQQRVLRLWEGEPDVRLKMADKTWRSIVAKEGKPLP